MKRIFTPVLSLLILFVCLSASAQNAKVKGVISDKTSNETLPSASVGTPDGTYGTAADFDGNYVLELPAGTHKLIFSYIGYSDKTVEVTLAAGETKVLNMAIGESETILNMTVVTGSLYEKNLAEETVSIDIVDKETVQNSNSRELGEAINRSNGVQVTDGQISIRGGNSYSYGIGTRTAVLVDGLNYASSDLGEATLKFAPIENTEQIEVVKGASSVVYGSSALNGVVNVRTAWSKSKTPEYKFNAYYGMYTKPPRDILKWWDAGSPFYNGFTFNYSQKVGRTSLVVGSAMDFSRSFLETNDEFRVRFNFKSKYQSKRNENLNFGMNANFMRENSDRYFIGPDMEFHAYRILEGSEDRYWYFSLNPHLTYLMGSHRVKVDLSYFNKLRQGNSDDVNASNNKINLHPQHQWTWRDKLVITSGIPIEYSLNKSNLYEDLGNRFTYNISAYSQAEFKHNNLSLQGGLRLETAKVDSLDSEIFPVFRSGLNYKVGRGTYLRGSWGQGFRVPTLGERLITADFIADVVFVFPNPDLVVEKSWNLELGVKQLFKIGEKWEGYFDFAFFLQEYKNLVEFRFGTYTSPTRIGLGLKAFNVELARIAGYEASVAGRGSIGPIKVQGGFGYTYTYPGNISDLQQTGGIQQGNPAQKSYGTFFKNFFKYMFTKVEDDPETDFNEIRNLLQFRSRHLLRADIQLEYKNFMVGYTLVYNSFIERVPDLFKLAASVIEAPVYGRSIINYEESSIYRYFQVHENGDYYMDMRFGYNFNENVRLGLVLKNMLNREFAKRPLKLEPPRSIVLTFGVKF